MPLAWCSFKWADRMELLKPFAFIFSADFIKRFGDAYVTIYNTWRAPEWVLATFPDGYINFNPSIAWLRIQTTTER